MELYSYLNNINKINPSKLTNGKSITIKDFFEDVIKPNLVDEKSIIGWHSILMRYVYENQNTLFLRRFASGKDTNGKWSRIRRGFLTEYKNEKSYVFCDNYFAHYFDIMAIDGYIPEYKDFYKTIADHSFPYGFMDTSEERELQAFHKGKIVNINKNHWKLSHVFSVNQNYEVFSDYKLFINEFFPRGERSEWTSNGKYISRIITKDMKNEEYLLLKAHFLRLSHPINYFLTPQNKFENNDVCKDIGEYPKLIQYVFDYYYEKHPQIMKEYLTEILAPTDYKFTNFSTANEVINIQYGPYIIKSNHETKLNNKSIKSSKSKKLDRVTTEQLHEMAFQYLTAGISFRNLEIEVLNICSPIRGGGFVAKKLLNDFGIDYKNKSTISKENFEIELNKATGKYKEVLNEIKYKFE